MWHQDETIRNAVMETFKNVFLLDTSTALNQEAVNTKLLSPSEIALNLVHITKRCDSSNEYISLEKIIGDLFSSPTPVLSNASDAAINGANKKTVSLMDSSDQVIQALWNLVSLTYMRRYVISIYMCWTYTIIYSTMLVLLSVTIRKTNFDFIGQNVLSNK